MEERKFYLDSPQPIEKPQFHQRNPRKSKLFSLDFLGFPWTNLTGARTVSLRNWRDEGETMSFTLRSIALQFADVLLRVKLEAELLN